MATAIHLAIQYLAPAVSQSMLRRAPKACQRLPGSRHLQVNTVLRAVNTILRATSKVNIALTAISRVLANPHITPVFPGSMDSQTPICKVNMDNQISHFPPRHRISMDSRPKHCRPFHNRVHMGSQTSPSLPCRNMVSMGSTPRLSHISHKALMVSKARLFRLQCQASTDSRIKHFPLHRKASTDKPVSKISCLPSRSKVHSMASSLSHTPKQDKHRANTYQPPKEVTFSRYSPLSTKVSYLSINQVHFRLSIWDLMDSKAHFLLSMVH